MISIKINKFQKNRYVIYFKKVYNDQIAQGIFRVFSSLNVKNIQIETSQEVSDDDPFGQLIYISTL